MRRSLRVPKTQEERDRGGMFRKTGGGTLKSTSAVGLNMTAELSIVVLHIASVWPQKKINGDSGGGVKTFI